VRCAACGHDSVDAAKFCAECGAALARRCASCQSELTAGAKFCAECDAPVGGAAGKVTEKERPRVLGDDTARVQLLHEAQRRYATIGAPGHAARLAGELAA
jgi:predicted amidophosphoribosyltransferase